MQKSTKFKAIYKRFVVQIREEITLRRDLLEFLVLQFAKKDRFLIKDFMGMKYEVFKNKYFWKISIIRKLEENYRKHIDPDVIVIRIK